MLILVNFSLTINQIGEAVLFQITHTTLFLVIVYFVIDFPFYIKIYRKLNIEVPALRRFIEVSYENFLNFSNETEFIGFIKDIIDHPEYQKLKMFHHHEHSIYGHSLHVSWISYRVGKLIDKYIIKVRIRELVRGAVLHDFFLYNWRKDIPPSGGLHAFAHPKEAFINSQKYFAPVSSVEKDIILKHMWPLCVIPPRFLETLIVIIVDKLVATKELFVEVLGKLL